MLTLKQKRVRDFYGSFIKKHGYSPSLEEAARRLYSSKSAVHEIVQRLQGKGELEKGYHRSRSVGIPTKARMVQVPLLGTISAGQPLTLFDAPKETIAVPANRIPNSGDVYALRVQGESMIEENIKDGDIILVKQQAVAENGQKVVALIDNSEATIKKFYNEGKFIRLQPANKTMAPIIIRKGEREFVIQGIFIDVIREENPTPIVLPRAKREERQYKNIKTYYERPGFKLYQVNCLDVLAELPENSVDMVFADPPYNLSNGGFTVHAGRMVSVNKGDWDKSKGFQDDYNFHYKWLEACRRVLKPNGTLWVSGTYHSIYQCGHALQALGYHILNDITWFKPNASPNLSCRYFTASHETLIWARKEKKARHAFNYNLMKNGRWTEDNLKKPGLQMRSVWSIGTPKPVEKKFGKHPTQKPEGLLKRVVLAGTNKGDLIVDPFTGSSTTGIVAYLHGRKFIGIDTEAKFLDLSIKRFEELGRNLKGTSGV